MFEMNTAGYDLLEVSLDHWVFRINGRSSVAGSFQQIVTIMVLAHGFNTKDIEDAISEMVKGDHDAIHFGVYKSMIYPYSQKDKKIA